MTDKSQTTISPENLQLINNSPFLQSLLYDLDLLPEQLSSQDELTDGLTKAWVRLDGVLLCYKAVKQLETRGVDL